MNACGAVRGLSRSILTTSVLALIATGCGSVVVDDRGAGSGNVFSTGAGGGSAGSASGGTGSASSGSGGASGVNDCTAPNITQLASGQKEPFTIAVDATNVYWGDALPVTGPDAVARIFTVPKAGGIATEIATTKGILASVLVDDTNVYWAVNEYKASPPTGNLYSMPKAGGPVTTVFSSKSPNLLSLTMDESRFYWVNNGGLLVSVSKSGGETTLLAENAEPVVGHTIVVDQDRVYWKSSSFQLMATSKLVGGDAQALTGLDMTQGDFTIDDALAFWVSVPWGPGEQVDTIFTTPKSGGAAVSVFHQAHGAGELRQFGPCLYWRTPAPSSDVSWSLSAALKGGGEPIVLVQQGDGLGGEVQAAYTVDASGVYWVDRYSGTVMKATK